MPFFRQLRRDQRKAESTYLAGHSATVTSQNGEDGVIAKIFDLIGTDSRWCVEFGAWDGKKYSNTWSLINDHGWSSVQIEGDAERYAELLVTHGANPDVQCLHEMVGFDPRKDSIDVIFARSRMPKAFDFMSIDVDGNDYHIWHSMTKYRPRVMVVEFNWDIPNDVVFIQDRDWEVNQGCSLRALVELGKKRNYELCATISSNAFFIDRDEFPKLGIADNHIDSMYFPHRDGKIFLLYDGTIGNIGMGTLHLRQADKKPFTPDPLYFQHYPPEDRGFGGSVPKDARPKDAAD